ncbi:MAG: hypothetical protein ACJ76H_16500, partial [Bacteriovoracaceae bacterium]
MKILILVISALVSFNSFATNSNWVSLTKKILKEHAEECKSVQISVDEIVKNNHIKGHVTGLKEESLDDFRMIFYVKTNKWYVHPYQYNQNQTSGYSYSDLSHGGEFWIRSVFRTAAKEMAVLLVPSTHLVYNSKWTLKGLKKYAC